MKKLMDILSSLIFLFQEKLNIINIIMDLLEILSLAKLQIKKNKRKIRDRSFKLIIAQVIQSLY